MASVKEKSMGMDAAIRPHIRWMIRRDMPEVMEIEGLVFGFPWREEDFIRCLHRRNCIGMVAEKGNDVAGYMIYELHKTRLHLLNLAIAPRFSRRRVGSAMVNKLIGTLSQIGRTRVLLEVREGNTDAQLFFKAMGFRAVGVLKDFFDDSDEDAYLMQYRVGKQGSWPVASNRCGQESSTIISTDRPTVLSVTVIASLRERR